MAIFHPEDLSYYTLTGSEEIMIDELKKQLSDDYQVFYSIRWTDNNEDSECDFLIFNLNYGFLCIEVKGGKSLGVHNNNYFIDLDDGERRYLKCSPHSQAEKSMRHFLKTFKELYNKSYDGVYGYAAAFPLYNIKPNLYDENATRETTINFSDMNNLNQKIRNAFKYYQNKSAENRRISLDDNQKFLNIINKTISIAHIKGGHNQLLRKQIDELTRSQGGMLDFISNYKRAIITGGAGTGKSFIAYSKVMRNLDQMVLFVTLSDSLKEYARDRIIKENDKALNVSFALFEEVHLINSKYDWIIIDEGQDINSECLNHLSNITNNLYFFADFHQQRKSIIDLNQVKKILKIDYPSFNLSQNVRSTSSIIEYLNESFNEIPMYYKNNINGSRPENIKIDSIETFRKYISDLIRKLVYIENVDPLLISILFNGNSAIKYIIEIIADEINLHDKIQISDLDLYKGHENDVVIFVNQMPNTIGDKYIAYTRAKILLYEIEYTHN
jgi:hypothetical protein